MLNQEGVGDISTEKTAWCSRCAVWEQLTQDMWRPSAPDEFRRRGWRKINGKWVCPDCLAELATPTPAREGSE